MVGKSNFDAVVWTDLPSNFVDKTGFDFSVSAAIKYLERLHPTVREVADTYIRRAPLFTQTPFRRAMSDTI
jgi:hypothetical protein